MCVSVFSFFLSFKQAVSRSSQCSMTGATKALVCAVLSGMVHIKDRLLLIEKSSQCFFSLFEWSFMRTQMTKTQVKPFL